MKRTIGPFIVFIVLLACAEAIFAQDAGRITSVVLYPGSAVVERTARVAQGAQRVELAGLPSNFDAQSIRVDADPGIHIGQVSIKDTARAEAASGREAEIEARIQALEDQKAVLDIDAKSAALVRDYLAHLSGGPDAGDKPRSSGVDAKSLPGVIDTISRAGSEAYSRMQRAEVKKRALDKQIQALQRDLARIRSGARDARAITINVAAERAGDIRVSYQMNGAGWRPTYRAELDSGKSTVALERQAAVSQKTGEDWTGVKMKLSTTQPRRSPQGPEPYTWQLSVREPTPVSSVDTFASQRMLASPPAPAPAAKPAARPVEAPFAIAEFQTTFATEFEVPGTVDLPADGRQLTVSLSKQSVAVRQRVRVVPRLDTAAIVTAEAERPEGVWLPGMIQLYRDGNLVGATNWNSESSDKLVFPFGRDDRIRVTVDRVKYRSSDAGFLGGRVEREVAYTFTLANLHKSPMEILVLESSPVSSSDKIEIKSTFEPKPKFENWEKRQGVVGWEQPVAAGATLKLTVDYAISYPKDVTVVGLP